MKIFNRYAFYARYIPGLISIMPVSLIYFFITREYAGFSLNEYFQSLTFVAGVSGTFIITYFVSMITREFGAVLETRYFKRHQGFPTTYLMLYTNSTLPKQVKNRYSDRIKNDFDIYRIPEEDESNNMHEAISILEHASRLLSTKYQQDKQVVDANIAYGFSRNVSGGLYLAVPGAVITIVIGWLLNNNALLFWGVVILSLYLIIALFHKRWIFSNAEKYAEKLFSVYLSV